MNTTDNAVEEVYLDIEVIGAMAPAATIDVYFAPWTGEGYLTAIKRAVQNDDYAAISISYGLDEDLQSLAGGQAAWPALHAHVEEAFKEAAAIGVPLFVSTGDQGSSCDRGFIFAQGQQVGVTVKSPATHAGYPSSSVYATAVGGTMLYAKNGAIDKEIVWNELGPLQQGEFQNEEGTFVNGSYYFFGATGGAVSSRYDPPSYQTGAGVNPTSSNPGGKPGRGVPDVAGNAGSSTGYLVSQPQDRTQPITVVGGTSAAAPMWAALMACVRESLAATFGGAPPTYFFNDFVYANGASGAFRDIVGGRDFAIGPDGSLQGGEFKATGDNRSSDVNGYSTAAGYDLCTGWGSPNGNALLQVLTNWLRARPPARTQGTGNTAQALN
jgi:kumamolisin